MKKRLIPLLLALTLLLSFAAACSKEDKPAESSSPSVSDSAPPPSSPSTSPSVQDTPSEPASPEAPATVTFTDFAGREVEIPANITKIAPSGALAQMFILAIAPDLLVTIASEYTPDSMKYIPADLDKLPVVGQFYGSEDLNVESIAAIGPDIVIDIGEPKNTIVEDMDSITETMAIPAIHITATLQSSPEAFRTLGRILGREADGEALAQYCEKVLTQTEDILAAVGGEKASILYCLGDSGLNVLAATSFHAEVLDYITNNLAVVDSPSSRGTGNETDLEQIMLWDPDIIIFAPNSVYGTVGSDPAWGQLKAVKNGAYYEVPFGPYNWMGSPPSINRYLGMLWLTSILYPEAADFDLQAEVTEYYKLFYHHELTAAEYSELTQNSLLPVGG